MGPSQHHQAARRRAWLWEGPHAFDPAPVAMVALRPKAAVRKTECWAPRSRSAKKSSAASESRGLKSTVLLSPLSEGTGPAREARDVFSARKTAGARRLHRRPAADSKAAGRLP